jgi:hypothetical protein
LVGLIYAKLKENPWKISVCRGRLFKKVAVSGSLTCYDFAPRTPVSCLLLCPFNSVAP